MAALVERLLAAGEKGGKLRTKPSGQQDTVVLANRAVFEYRAAFGQLEDVRTHSNAPLLDHRDRADVDERDATESMDLREDPLGGATDPEPREVSNRYCNERAKEQVTNWNRNP